MKERIEGQGIPLLFDVNIKDFYVYCMLLLVISSSLKQFQTYTLDIYIWIDNISNLVVHFACLCWYWCVCVCVCVLRAGASGELTVILMLSNLDHSVTYGEPVPCEIDMKDLTFTASFTATRDAVNKSCFWRWPYEIGVYLCICVFSCIEFHHLTIFLCVWSDSYICLFI